MKLIIADVLVVDGAKIRKPKDSNEINKSDVTLTYLYQMPDCSWRYLYADLNGWTVTSSLTNPPLLGTQTGPNTVSPLTNLQRALQHMENQRG